jgi:hypothetical protein
MEEDELGKAYSTRGGWKMSKVCLRSKDAFVVTCAANLMEVKVLYVQ